MTTLQLPANRRDAAARAWRNAARVARGIPPLVDRFSGFEREIAQAVEGRHYEIGLIEHFWCAPYLEVISPACRRTVIDLHNVESVLHARMAEVERPAAGFAHRVFRQASLDLERNLLPRFSEVLAVSAADAGQVRSIAPAAHVRVYPNAIPWRPEAPRHRHEHVVVFSGNLEYHPNLSAVRFFRGEVWPRLRAEWPELVWRLVGKNPDGIPAAGGGDARIEIRGAVDDAVCELARASVAVVPLLAGSGTRFKILEAWAAGLPVVSTTIGAEGLPVRHGRRNHAGGHGAGFAGRFAAVGVPRNSARSWPRPADCCWKKNLHGKQRGKSWTFNTLSPSWSAILVRSMRFAVDAHAIGRHLTGNEVYVRSLLNAFAAKDRGCEFVAYVSARSARIHPGQHSQRRIAANPYLRLGCDLAMQGPSGPAGPAARAIYRAGRLSAPVVVSVHDVSFLEHPEYFPRSRALAVAMDRAPHGEPRGQSAHGHASFRASRSSRCTAT